MTELEKTIKMEELELSFIYFIFTFLVSLSVQDLMICTQNVYLLLYLAMLSIFVVFDGFYLYSKSWHD